MCDGGDVFTSLHCHPTQRTHIIINICRAVAYTNMKNKLQKNNKKK